MVGRDAVLREPAFVECGTPVGALPTDKVYGWLFHWHSSEFLWRLYPALIGGVKTYSKGSVARYGAYVS